ncbi:MAG: hypothetical protein JWL95_1806, partial [Gemmatimonadetes bacterium]|nr:hypothetical protein [Gemmatimonadota bacterium]
MRRALLVPFALLALLPPTISACAAPRATIASSPVQATLATDDRIRLAETFRLAGAIGDQIWPAWTSAPFAVLLVTPDREFLVRHPRPTADFSRVGYDSLLGGDVFSRPRKLAPSFLATYPAVGGVPTIVVGQPAATQKSSTTWVLTLLHEHFHQLQMSRPGYYDGVAALGLSRGDQTGMWMLNFPFPYDSSAVAARFAELTRRLDGALDDTRGDSSAARWRAVADARATLRAALSSDDEKYLAFQMWQEGVARYTELQVARWAAERYASSAAFRALPDYTSFGSAAAAIEGKIRAELRASDLGRARRVLFYPVGAAT